ncbi:MAG: hypothetical protein AAGB19_09465 [Cyanobacteria bacterium P01_F01_bin.3]
MTRFHSFTPAATTQPGDELLLVRGGHPRRLTVGALSTVATGPTPPETAARLWLQTDDEGRAIEPWFLHKSGHWLSEATYPIDAYRAQVTHSTTRQAASPYLGSKLWIDSFSAKCIPVVDFGVDHRTDFQLRLINEAKQQAVVWYLRLENGVRNQAFQQSESIEQVVDATDALALCFRVQRTGTTALRYVSMSAILRKVWDDAST